MLDAIGATISTAVITVFATRWLDDRRHRAEGRAELAAELRGQLSAAHRSAESCVWAFTRAWDLVAASDGHGADSDTVAALDAFDRSIDELRSHMSDIVMRTDPTERNGPNAALREMISAGFELSRWMRYGEIPEDWGGYEEGFCICTPQFFEAGPWFLAQTGAPVAAPGALGYELEAILSNKQRRERRELRRRQIGYFCDWVIGRTRRERRRQMAYVRRSSAA
jgi:hypothetical protein